MRHVITAILLAQWRSMRTFHGGVLSWISGLLFYGFWAAVAFGAQAFFANTANAHLFGLALSAGLALVLFYWQITPVITASMGASLDLKKLLAYPIPHGTLFTVELLLRLTTCAEMLLVLAGVVIGLARSSPWAALPRLLAVVLTYIAINILLSAAVRSFLERLLLRKRMKEAMMFLLIAITIGPQFLLMKGFRPKNVNSSMFPDAPYLPWSAASHLLLGTGFVIPALTLFTALVAAYVLARWQFETGLHFDGASSKIRATPSQPASSRWEPLFRWPALLFADPTAAIMEKELRSLLRTSQFRFIFFTGAAFGLLISLPRMMRGGHDPGSFFYTNMLTISSIYGVMLLGGVSYFNCFGYDRSAAQAWFSYPIPLIRTLVAKNLAALTFILAETAMVTVTAALLLQVVVTPAKIAETLLVTLVAALYLLAFGNIASVRMPRALNPDKISQGGSAKTTNALILIAVPVILLPIGIAYWARSVFQNEFIFFGLIAFAAALGAVLYTIGLNSAAATGSTRREKILTDLSKGEGPVSAG
jgi:ABC-2 type transport system permease protein